jgi:hypothetical protein
MPRIGRAYYDRYTNTNPEYLQGPFVQKMAEIGHSILQPYNQSDWDDNLSLFNETTRGAMLKLVEELRAEDGPEYPPVHSLFLFPHIITYHDNKTLVQREKVQLCY